MMEKPNQRIGFFIFNPNPGTGTMLREMTLTFRTQLRDVVLGFRTQRVPECFREVSRFFSSLFLCKEIEERNPDPIYHIGSLTPLKTKHCGLAGEL